MSTSTTRRIVLTAALLVSSAALPSGLTTSLRSVRVESQGATTLVVIEADGPLPRPRVGVLGDPPRIYLDFPQVRPTTTGTYPDPNAPVHGVRVALNQAQPLLTRVVIDLAAPMPHRLDTRLLERGRLTVLVGPSPEKTPAVAPAPPPSADKPGAAPKPTADGQAAPSPVVPAAQPAPSAPPVAPLSPPPPPPGNASRADTFNAFASNARATSGQLPAKDVEKYMQKARPAIDRLERARPVLVSLDAQSNVPEDQLAKAAEEFESIRRVLVAIQPPAKLDATHQLLCQACMLAATAAATRTDRSVAEGTRASTAASAAAGALMLIERARADLQLPARSGS